MRKLSGILLALMLCGCAARGDHAPGAVPLRFVPATQSTTDACHQSNASWSAFVPFPDKDGRPHVFAHAGVGDSFPVAEKDGPTLFEVFVVSGNDDHLVLEIQSKGPAQRIDVARDKSVPVQVAGGTYELMYPRVSVSSTGRTTTGQAMIIVMRRP